MISFILELEFKGSANWTKLNTTFLFCPVSETNSSKRRVLIYADFEVVFIHLLG